MAWKCIDCGFENVAESARECAGGCGYVRFGQIVLADPATGRQLRMAVDTAVGCHILKSLGCADAVYASEPQFFVCRDATLAAWSIRPAATARHPTYLNGVGLDGTPRPLDNGAVISLAKDRLRLVVGFAPTPEGGR